jgi:hypothetical protein
MGIAAQSCSSEDSLYGDGEGTLKLKLVINSEVTRAEVDQQSLADGCLLFISDSKGLLHKFNGIGEVPDNLALKTGNYTLEAWAGDSVSASFDKKFYKAYQPITIEKGVNNVVVECKIANVVASVNPATIDDTRMSDYKITVANSRASLDFTDENIVDSHGYFMMPYENDKYEDELSYTITGKSVTGQEFTKTGTISDVKPAHEYILNLKYDSDADPNDVGGAFISVVVDDEELLIEDEIVLHSAPRIAGIGFDISSAIIGEQTTFSDKYVSAHAYGDFSSLQLSFSSNIQAALGLQYSAYDIIQAEADALTELKNTGLTWNSSFKDEYKTYNLIFSADLINKFTNSDDDYVVTITATDSEGRSKTNKLTFTVCDASVVPNDVAEDDLGYTSVTLTAEVIKDDVTNPGIQYREVGTTAWSTAYASRSRSTVISVTISGLKNSTTYEYRAIADGYVNNVTKRFTTRTPFALPNASFEDWSTYSASTLLGTKNVAFPGTGSTRTFWDSGNEGSATANMTLTNKSTDMVHSGTYCVALKSNKAMGILAAGNLFVGYYVKTDGTDGVLSLGREYDGSRPSKLVVWANYRPGSVDILKDSSVPLTSGSLDNGQIYVALSTEPIEIRTKSSDRKLFDKDDSAVLAYGQVTWTDNFGADNTLEKVEIPIEYNSRANSNTPKYIIIVASASKYGDYFSGSSSSVMYLDDFELVYE